MCFDTDQIVALGLFCSVLFGLGLMRDGGVDARNSCLGGSENPDLRGENTGSLCMVVLRHRLRCKRSLVVVV